MNNAWQRVVRRVSLPFVAFALATCASAGNDTLNTAANIGSVGSSTVTVTGSFQPHWGFSIADHDWYRFRPTGSELSWTVSGSVVINFNIALYSASGNLLDVWCTPMSLAQTKSGKVSVSPNTDYYIMVDSDTGYTVENYRIELKSSGSSTVSTSVSSLSISGPNFVAGGSVATYKCTANYSDGSSRSVTPTWEVTSGGNSASISSSGALSTKSVATAQNVTIKATYSVGSTSKSVTYAVRIESQGASEHTLAISPTSVDCTSALSSENFSVVCDSSWQVSKNVTWIMLDTTSGVQAGKVYYRVQANTSVSPRSGIITVTCGDQVRTFIVRQQGSGNNVMVTFCLNGVATQGLRILLNDKTLELNGQIMSMVDVVAPLVYAYSGYQDKIIADTESAVRVAVMEQINGENSVGSTIDRMTVLIGNALWNYSLVTRALDNNTTEGQLIRQIAEDIEGLIEEIRSINRDIEQLDVQEKRMVAKGMAIGALPEPDAYDGVEFDGWWDVNNGGVRATGSTVVSDDTILYAKWVAASAPTVPPAPGNVSATDGTSASVINVSWAAVSGATSYEIYRATSQGGAKSKIGESQSVGYSDANVSTGMTYWYFVKAVNTAGVSDYSLGDSGFLKTQGGEDPVAPTYGPWGEAEAVKNPDKLGPTMLTDMTLELNGAAGAVGDVVAAFRGDTGALCGLGKVMDESGTLSMVCYAPTGVKLHFKVWVAASGVEEPVVVDCDVKSDLTAPTSGAFLSGHALVVSDDKDLTISLGSADWHTVSFNVLPEDPSPAAVFGSVKDKIAAVTQGIEFWMPGKTSSLKAIEIGKGYWVNTKVDNVEWTVSGKTDPKAEIALEEGWNLVGYAPEAEGAVQTVLKTALAAKAVDYVTYGVEFYPGGTLKKMEPGKAYWVHAKKAWRLVYDEVGTTVKAARASGDRKVAAPLVGAAVPTYGPWGESEAVKNPDKLGPTFLTDMAVEIDGEPAEYGDVVAVFRGDTGALCGLGKVMDDSGTLTVVCYAPKGVTLSFKVWLSESGVEEAVVVKCDNASKLVAPDVGAFHDGHAISGSTAELIETIVPGEKVTIDTGLIGYTVSGLPTGLKYDKTSGKITGSASKPTAAEGVVVKFTKKGFETEELTIVVTAIPKVTVAMEGVNSPGDTDGCKVTGADAYLVGKKVTLKATVPKGTVFMGWSDDEGVVATQATYSIPMGKENVALVAKFKKEVMSVGCEALSSKESFPAGVLGAEGGIELDISTESGVKSIKVDKLPSGMKYDSKTGLITGAPIKAGDNTVVITVTAVSGAVEKREIKVSVAAMPVMAVGTFSGFVSVGKDNFGTFTLTTTDTGMLTAKVVTAAGTVSFSGTCWDADEEGVYRAMLTTKKGEKLTLTLDSTAAWDANQLSGEFTTAEIAATKKAAAVPSRSYSVSAQKNAFGKTWYFTAVGDETTGWTLDYAATAKAAALTVTLKADGTTAIAGSLPGLPDTKGKATSLKVSASGYANIGLMREGVIAADFAPVLTVNKMKTILAIRTNLWFDRKNDHGSGVGEARFIK